VDFRKEEAPQGGAHVEPGIYRVRITKAKAVTSTEKGTPGLELHLKTLDGSRGNKGQTVVHTLWASPKTFHRYRELLQALGKAVKNMRLSTIAKAVQGAEVYVALIDERNPQEGYEPRTEVRFREGFLHPDAVEDDDYDEGDEGDEDDYDEDDDGDDEEEWDEYDDEDDGEDDED
jgi:hypothetical protein